MLPITVAEDTFRKLQSYRDAFLTYASDFAAEYPDIYESLRQQVTMEIGCETAAKLFSRIPSDPEQVRQKFYFNWTIIPVGYNNLSEGNIARLTEACAEAKQAGLSGIVDRLEHVLRDVSCAASAISTERAQLLTQEARQQMQEDSKELVMSLSEEPRQRLLEAVKRLSEAVTDNRNIRASTLERIQEAVQLVNSFSFVQSEEVLRESRNLANYLRRFSPADINAASEQTRQAIATVIDKVVQVTQDAEKAARARQNFLAIDL